MSETSRRLCFACRNAVDSDEQFVLARGRQRLAHCSEACVRETLRGRWRRARTRSRLHVIASATVAALVLVGGWTVLRHRAPQPRSIALSWVDVTWDKPAPAGTDVLRPGLAAHRRRLAVRVRSGAVGVSAAGPVAPRAGRRRSPVRDRSARASDGVPDARHVRRRAGRPALGRARLRRAGRRRRSRGARRRRRARRRLRAHRPLRRHGLHALLSPGRDPARRGARRDASRPARSSVWSATPGRAAKNAGPHPHLHFALSIRPSAEWPETFWDPTPLMATWPLRVPPHGSVAGLVAATDTMEIPRRHRGH